MTLHPEVKTLCLSVPLVLKDLPLRKLSTVMREDLIPFCESLVSAENSDAGTLKGQSIDTHSSAPIHQNPAQG